MAKLSECADYSKKFQIAYSYCETNGLLGEIANMSSQRREIDSWIRYKIEASQKRVPVSAYLFYLKKAVEERKDDYKKLKKETNMEHVTLCLYKMIENDLPDKLVFEPTI